MNVDDIIKGKIHKGVVRPKPEVSANQKRIHRYTVEILDPYSIKRVLEVFDRHRWLDEFVGVGNYTVLKTRERFGIIHEFVFYDKSHALMFKLTWGGK